MQRSPSDGTRDGCPPARLSRHEALPREQPPRRPRRRRWRALPSQRRAHPPARQQLLPLLPGLPPPPPPRRCAGGVPHSPPRATQRRRLVPRGVRARRRELREQGGDAHSPCPVSVAVDDAAAARLRSGGFPGSLQRWRPRADARLRTRGWKRAPDATGRERGAVRDRRASRCEFRSERGADGKVSGGRIARAKRDAVRSARKERAVSREGRGRGRGRGFREAYLERNEARAKLGTRRLALFEALTQPVDLLSVGGGHYSRCACGRTKSGAVSDASCHSGGGSACGASSVVRVREAGRCAEFRSSHCDSRLSSHRVVTDLPLAPIRLGEQRCFPEVAKRRFRSCARICGEMHEATCHPCV